MQSTCNNHGCGKQRALFLDRDGVINVDHGYVSRSADFEFMPNIFSVLRSLSEKGYVLVVVTNQSGIGRGYYTDEEFNQLTAWMIQRFSDEGIDIEGVYRCPHSPGEGCVCRKPEPGMFLQAEEELGVDLSASWMVGDKESDMQAAEAAGIRNRVFLGANPPSSSTCAVESLDELLELSM